MPPNHSASGNVVPSFDHIIKNRRKKRKKKKKKKKKNKNIRYACIDARKSVRNVVH